MAEARSGILELARWIVLGVALAGIAGCSQDAAPIEYKGSEYYGREHQGALDSTHETYPADSARYKEGYTHPAEQAATPGVGVSDLPPPNAENKQETSIASEPQAAPHAAAQGDTKFIWPVASGKIISHFGPKSGNITNDGINISVAEGEPIWAAADGMVVYAGNELKGYGNMVILRHDGGWMTVYAHARSISVKKHDYVKQGEIVGYVGMSGGVKSPQLHFVVREGKTPVDPEQYLPGELAGN